MDNNIIVYIIIGVVAVIAAFFALRRKPEQLAPSPTQDKKPLPSKTADKGQLAPAPAKSAEQPATAKRPEPTTLPASDVSPASEARSGPVPASAKQAPAQPAAPKTPADVPGIRKGLAATRGGFIARLRDIFVGKKEIDPAILQQIEEVMLSSDVGVKTTQAILGRLRDALDKNELRDEGAVWAALRAEAIRVLSAPASGGAIRIGSKPTVVLMVGVNGVGKTTTIGKLATRHKGEGQQVVLAAGDTFRAAAVQQLEVWGKRIGVDVIKGKDGGDPAAVAFDATTKSKEKGVDLLLIDTAGRLRQGVRRGAARDLARARRDDGAERADAGDDVQRRGGADGYHPDEARRHGEGRHHPGHLRRAEAAGALHRPGRARGGPSRVPGRGVRRGPVRQGR
jgi:fused signal recognition particle receptor